MVSVTAPLYEIGMKTTAQYALSVVCFGVSLGGFVIAWANRIANPYLGLGVFGVALMLALISIMHFVSVRAARYYERRLPGDE